MSLVEQWNRLEQGLDPRWSDARLTLRVDEAGARKRAARLLAPAGPGVSGSEIRFTAARGGTGIGPEALRRLLRKIDDEGLDGALTLVSAGEAVPEPVLSRPSAAAAWEAALAVLPSDWSDLLCELELGSSLDLERAAVLLDPLNPLQGTGRPGFRFRSARERGFGVPAAMVRRCLERLDAAAIGAEVRIVQVLCDTHPVQTQGAVWMLGGRPT